MDYMRNCYSADCQFGTDASVTRRIQWFRCAPGAEPLDYPHAFGSKIWSLGMPYEGVGERPHYADDWRNGSFPVVIPPKAAPCGPKLVFQVGSPDPDPIGLPRYPWGLARCCLPNGVVNYSSPVGGVIIGETEAYRSSPVGGVIIGETEAYRSFPVGGVNLGDIMISRYYTVRHSDVQGGVELGELVDAAYHAAYHSLPDGGVVLGDNVGVIPPFLSHSLPEGGVVLGDNVAVIPPFLGDSFPEGGVLLGDTTANVYTPAPPPPILYDDFHDVTGTLLSAHPLVIKPVGSVWTVAAYAGQGSASDATIQANTCQDLATSISSPAAWSDATAGRTDGTVTLKWTYPASGDGIIRAIGRVQDVNNHWFIQYSGDAGVFYIGKIQGGANSYLNSVAVLAGVASGAYVLTLNFAGNVITGTCTGPGFGPTSLSLTNALFNTQTSFGFHIPQTGILTYHSGAVTEFTFEP
jgi:hypothetical protein